MENKCNTTRNSLVEENCIILLEQPANSKRVHILWRLSSICSVKSVPRRHPAVHAWQKSRKTQRKKKKKKEKWRKRKEEIFTRTCTAENKSPVVFLAVYPWLLFSFQVSLPHSLSLSLSLFFSESHECFPIFLSLIHTRSHIRAATKFCPIIRRITCPRLASSQRYHPTPCRPGSHRALFPLDARRRTQQKRVDQKARVLSASDGWLDDHAKIGSTCDVSTICRNNFFFFSAGARTACWRGAADVEIWGRPIWWKLADPNSVEVKGCVCGGSCVARNEMFAGNTRPMWVGTKRRIASSRLRGVERGGGGGEGTTAPGSPCGLWSRPASVKTTNNQLQTVSLRKLSFASSEAANLFPSPTCRFSHREDYNPLAKSFRSDSLVSTLRRIS